MGVKRAKEGSIRSKPNCQREALGRPWGAGGGVYRDLVLLAPNIYIYIYTYIYTTFWAPIYRCIYIYIYVYTGPGYRRQIEGDI